MKIKRAVINKEINIDEDLEVYQDTKFERSIKCKNIICKNQRWNISAGDIDAGNISAGDISAGNISAGNISAGNISAGDISAGNISAGDIDAWNIICEKRINRFKKAKTFCKVFIQERNKIENKDRNKEVKK